MEIQVDYHGSDVDLKIVLGGGPSHRNAQGVILVERVIFPITATNKEVASLPQPVGRGKIENHKRSARTPRKIKKALRCLIRAKKVKEQG